MDNLLCIPPESYLVLYSANVVNPTSSIALLTASSSLSGDIPFNLAKKYKCSSMVNSSHRILN